MTSRVLLSAAVLLAAASSPTWGQPRSSSTEIGEVRAFGGTLRVAVREDAGAKAAHLFVADRHVIKTNLLILTPAQLRQMRQLIDDTLAEVDPANAAAAPGR